jgi:hypothetical protein
MIVEISHLLHIPMRIPSERNLNTAHIRFPSLPKCSLDTPHIRFPTLPERSLNTPYIRIFSL